jgi:hypothetical protein
MEIKISESISACGYAWHAFKAFFACRSLAVERRLRIAAEARVAELVAAAEKAARLAAAAESDSTGLGFLDEPSDEVIRLQGRLIVAESKAMRNAEEGVHLYSRIQAFQTLLNEKDDRIMRLERYLKSVEGKRKAAKPKIAKPTKKP